MTSEHQILVVVHPGSACGSADFNLGPGLARKVRDALVHELEGWMGGVLVIDGELSDELAENPKLDLALKGALHRAAQSDQVSLRLFGDDPDQVKRITEYVMRMPSPARRNTGFHVTGAWYHSEDGGGCVGSVWQRLRTMGMSAQVSPNAVDLDAPGRSPNRRSHRMAG